MDNRSILDVHIVADAYGMNIPANDRIKPNAAIISHHHIACNCGVVCQKTIFPKDGFDALNCFY
jgi:hypothetical protein